VAQRLPLVSGSQLDAALLVQIEARLVLLAADLDLSLAGSDAVVVRGFAGQLGLEHRGADHSRRRPLFDSALDGLEDSLRLVLGRAAGLGQVLDRRVLDLGEADRDRGVALLAEQLCLGREGLHARHPRAVGQSHVVQDDRVLLALVLRQVVEEQARRRVGDRAALDLALDVRLREVVRRHELVLAGPVGIVLDLQVPDVARVLDGLVRVAERHGDVLLGALAVRGLDVLERHPDVVVRDQRLAVHRHVHGPGHGDLAGPGRVLPVARAQDRLPDQAVRVDHRVGLLREGVVGRHRIVHVELVLRIGSRFPAVADHVARDPSVEDVADTVVEVQARAAADGLVLADAVSASIGRSREHAVPAVADPV
jgi:hypothetical protein